jgi:hypothetical protein
MGPSEISTDVVVRHKFRFVTSSNGLFVITTKSLTALLSVCYTTNTAVRSIFYAAKLNSVEVWAPPGAVGSFATIYCRWSGGTFGADVLRQDCSVSLTEPAHLMCRPPPRTTAAFWSNNDSSTQLFSLGLPTNAIIDIDVSLIVCNASTTVVTAVSTGTDGYTYAMALDSQNGTAYCVPQGYVTTS